MKASLFSFYLLNILFVIPHILFAISHIIFVISCILFVISCIPFLPLPHILVKVQRQELRLAVQPAAGEGGYPDEEEGGEGRL